MRVSIHPRGCETSTKTRPFSEVFGVPEAEGEALSQDAALRDMVRSWSFLDQATKDIVQTIVKSRASIS
ncbi:hypothetical protein Poly59_32980 [Rubripirellula reticaptiva]|uniref:Uncharacterized protein n=1 Tax=Rubripirellula reticaptiva TaxID=2528013 RepID=A0A5C6EPM9_9BACT|nr:hypothetical protein Poly59_32980 [Rubripirellula reticaptiva]